MNIQISNIHFFFAPPRQPNQSIQRTTIVSDSLLSRNEIAISNKIQQIFNYFCFFNVVEEAEYLQVTDMNRVLQEDTDMDTLPEVDPALLLSTRSLICTYHDLHSVDFTDFLYRCTSMQQLLSYTIDSFQHITHGLTILHNHHLCFLDFSPKNIVFLQHAGEKPLLSDFKYCIALRDTPPSDIIHLVQTIPDFTYMPLEIHLLYSMYSITHTPMDKLTPSFVEEFCKEYVENIPIFRLFSPTFKQNYMKLCLETMREFQEQPIPSILSAILERMDRCVVFNISVLYIHIFGSILKVLALKDTFLHKIISKLLTNLHPNSTKRMSVHDLPRLIEPCFESNPSFPLPVDKMHELFQELST